MEALQKILIEEGKYSDVNYYFMQTALKCKNTYLTYKNGNLFLTVNSLISLNNIITGSRHIRLAIVKYIWTSLLLKLHYIL